MTREEAIMWLNAERKARCRFGVLGEGSLLVEAIDMAIEALQEPKIIIGIDIPYGSDKGIATLFKGKDDKLILEEVKELMSVVRCKDCKWWRKDTDLTCNHHSLVSPMMANDYCSYGERGEL